MRCNKYHDVSLPSGATPLTGSHCRNKMCSFVSSRSRYVLIVFFQMDVKLWLDGPGKGQARIL